MTARHEILIVEDNHENAEVLRDLVQSMDFGCRVVTTLEEVRACLESGFLPCGVLQDVQIPHAAGARPHEKAGESSIALVRARSRGAMRVPIVVLTAFRSEPELVWRMAELEADFFLEKTKIGALPDKLAAYLARNGRACHGDCERANLESQPAPAA
ncbi:MAG TPA: response regulator, partial [Polyangiaceae bacterium]